MWSGRAAERITGHSRHEAVGHCCIGEALLHCDQPGCEYCQEDCASHAPPSAAYGNWELSSDRANAARRVMQANGIRPDQITQVRGFADQRLRKPEAPLDPSNRRISLIVQYIQRQNDDEGAKPTTEQTEQTGEPKASS